MPLSLHPATLADRAAIASIIAYANFPDPYGQTVWPDSTIEARIEGGYARLAMTMLGDGAWFMKVVSTPSDPASTETQGQQAGAGEGEIVGYAQWTLPSRVWERVRARAESAGGIHAEVTPEMRQVFQREHDESEIDGWPIGLRREVVEAVSPGMRRARETAWGGDSREHIVLNQVKVLPEWQRKGVGSMLVKWGCDEADREGLSSRLEATPFGLGLYTKSGFVPKAEVHHDVSKFGGPAKYTHTLMLREPQESCCKEQHIG